ncbi:MAG: hypothetical protein RIS20_1610 [Bacteroidota bacterium]|jgi:hypothetical protein
MKHIVFFLLLLAYLSASAQNQVTDSSLSGPFIQFKNGIRVYVKKPVIVCENNCYYIDKKNDTVVVQPISIIEGFSKRSDIRWMTMEDFRKIGLNPVRGYFWSAVLIYPTGLGGFILGDLVKRRRIQRMYIDTHEKFYISPQKNNR